MTTRKTTDATSSKPPQRTRRASGLETWREYRRCRYCKAEFQPKRPQDADTRFCCAAHRKAFWRHGALPFDKMKASIEKVADERMKTLALDKVTTEVLEKVLPTLRKIEKDIAALNGRVDWLMGRAINAVAE